MREKRKAAHAVAAPEGERRKVEGITHGTAHGYNDNGCRCGDCTMAATDKRYLEWTRAKERV